MLLGLNVSVTPEGSETTKNYQLFNDSFQHICVFRLLFLGYHHFTTVLDDAFATN